MPIGSYIIRSSSTQHKAMMKNNSVVAVLGCFLMLIGSGSCACDSKDLTLKQSPTYKVEGNTKQWEAVIENGCPCTVLDLELECAGFRPMVPIDPSVLSMQGSRCLVNNGQPIYSLTSFKFTYAADSSFEFTVADFYPACS